MNSEVALIFYYTRENRNSYNALAGAMEKYPDIKRFNVFFLPNEKSLLQETPAISKKYKKVIIGISFLTPQYWQIKDIVEKLKKQNGSNVFLLAGGPHPTGAPHSTLKMGFDLVINSEGEESLLELLQKIINDEDYSEIKGISYLNEKKGYIYTGKQNSVDIDNFHPISEYFFKHGPIEISRGCPFGCSYCQVSHIFGREPRHRSIENILDCINILKRQGSTYFRFITPNTFSYGSKDGKKINYEKLDSLLFSIRNLVGRKRKIFFGSFPSEARPEHVNSDTIKILKKYADNDNLIIGAQSGSQRILDYINRGHSVHSIYEAVENTRRAGLKVNVDFIFGLPGETDEDILLTLKVIKDLGKLGARIHAHTFIPLPQTPFKNEKSGKLNPALKKEINNLCSKGIIYGEWRKQEKIAAKISAELYHALL